MNRFVILCLLLLLSIGCGGETTSEPNDSVSETDAIAAAEKLLNAIGNDQPVTSRPGESRDDSITQLESDRQIGQSEPTKPQFNPDQEADPMDDGEGALPVQIAGPRQQAEENPVDLERVKANGIRVLDSDHVELFTDLPESIDLSDLPKVFNQAIPQWCEYFEVDSEAVKDWKIRACVIKDRARFDKAGLIPKLLPEFKHGYSYGKTVFLFEQPSEYYRRHLLLHEGTHNFMLAFLDGGGPPWYMEGLAELLGTHRWVDEKLTLNIVPASRDDVPYWGRVKIVKDDVAQNQGRMLEDVMRYGSNAHLDVRPYGWCWAATAMLENDPRFSKAFRDRIAHVSESNEVFSLGLIQALGDDWHLARQQWQWFVLNMDYGFDLKRESIVSKPTNSLDPDGDSLTIDLSVDRGWQSTGLRLAAGQKVTITATGDFVIAREVRDGEELEWPCTADGVTLRYHNKRPLGELIAAVDNPMENGLTGLVNMASVGSSNELYTEGAGVLYLRINDHPAELHDNRGTLSIVITP